VRRVILLMTPCWWLLMFTVGRLREVRVFAELTVIYWCAIILIVSYHTKPWLAATGGVVATRRNPEE
jgi:hypothetical protein